MNIHSMAYVEMLMRMRQGQKVRRNKNFAPGGGGGGGGNFTGSFENGMGVRPRFDV